MNDFFTDQVKTVQEFFQVCVMGRGEDYLACVFKVVQKSNRLIWENLHFWNL